MSFWRFFLLERHMVFHLERVIKATLGFQLPTIRAILTGDITLSRLCHLRDFIFYNLNFKRRFFYPNFIVPPLPIEADDLIWEPQGLTSYLECVFSQYKFGKRNVWFIYKKKFYKVGTNIMYFISPIDIIGTSIFCC